MKASALFLSLDLLLAGFGISVPVWFFFIQAPVMMTLLGRERFMPVMMGLSRVLFQVLFIFVSANVLVAGVSYLQTLTMTSTAFVLLLVGWVAVSINQFVVVPKALAAGAASAKERKGDHSRDMKDMAVRGGGKAETKTLHQTVVVFTLLMVGALVGHVITAVS